MPTPRRIELNKPGILIPIHQLLEILSRQHNNILLISIPRLPTMLSRASGLSTFPTNPLIRDLNLTKKLPS